MAEFITEHFNGSLPRGADSGSCSSIPGPEAAELVKLLPAKKQERFYRLAIWPYLFCGFIDLSRKASEICSGGIAKDCADIDSQINVTAGNLFHLGGVQFTKAT